MTTRSVPVDLRLHVPAHTSMIAVVEAINELSTRLGSYWEYHSTPDCRKGRFELHDLTLPPSQETHS